MAVARIVIEVKEDENGRRIYEKALLELDVEDGKVQDVRLLEGNLRPSMVRAMKGAGRGGARFSAVGA